MRYLFLLGICLTACGGAKSPEVAPNPARGLRNLSTDDQEVSAIALAAARTLPPASAGLPLPFFGGVFADGKQLRQATSAVTRLTGFYLARTSRTPAPQCRRVEMSTGKSVPIQCPASAQAMTPPTYTFSQMTATADSAYVGILEASTNASKSSCLTLVFRSGSWTYFGTSVIADPKRCGK